MSISTASSARFAGDINLLSSTGTLLHSITRTTASDLIASAVGGNYYGWITYNDFDGLAIDNSRLTLTTAQVPEPGTLALLGLGIAGLLASRRKSA